MNSSLSQTLCERITGDVWVDDKHLARFSRDQSIYHVKPQVVVAPQGIEDVLATVRLCREAGVPLTCRGGGSGTAGAALGSGVVLAFQRGGPMSDLRLFDGGTGIPFAEGEPGVLHDDLQAALAEHGRFLPADPSSGSMCLLGGNVATKASGPHALRHGSIDRYLESLEFVTAAGEVVDTACPDAIPARLREGIVRLAQDVRSRPADVEALQRRRGRKIASGYNLFPMLDEDDPGRLLNGVLAGSVGTLGVVTRIRLRSEPKPAGVAALLLFFTDLAVAGEAVQVLLGASPAAIEIMNARSVDMVRQVRPGLAEGLPDCAAHMLLAEFIGETCQDAAQAATERVRQAGLRPAREAVVVTGEDEVTHLWKLRKALLPVVRGFSRELRPLSVVNDIGVPPEHLAEFIREIEELFAELGLNAAIYGHAGSGNLHLRPLFDIGRKDLAALVQRTADAVYERVLRHDGTITAEHGMGPIRAPYLRREWGQSLYDTMRAVKQLFDPDGVLNPGTMFSERPITEHAQLA
jgi:FAD/FMN-containing dehydrogenase